MLFTIVVAIVSGLLTGHVMVLGKTMGRRQSTDGSEDGRPRLYDDSMY